MANIEPLTRASAAWTGDRRDSFWLDGTTAAGGLATTPGKRRRLHWPLLRTFFFDAFTNGLDWTQARGVVATAWQPNAVTDVAGFVAITDTSIRGGNAADTAGWLHVLVGGTERFTGANDESPVAKGTAGWTQPGYIFLNHRHATPNTLAQAKVANAARFRLQVFPFTVPTSGDRWVATTGGRCSGIVAVAWQADGTTIGNRVAPTLDASGDVIFSIGAGGATGWLWVWRGR
jgi:hypothetical protein